MPHTHSSSSTTIPVTDIRLGPRHRKDLGDIEALARSIDKVGLLQPIVIRPDNTLVAGVRRLAACRMLGWQHVPVYVAANLDDELRLLLAERDENTCRLDFAPTEAVAVGRAVEEYEREAARERQGTRTDLEHSGKFPESEQGQTRDKVGATVGMSGKTYERAEAVVAAAESDPETFGDLPSLMDTENVSAAVREMRRRQQVAKLEAIPPPAGKYRVIYADPPWPYDNSGFDQSAASHYPTMSTEDIYALPIGNLADEECVLFLWATSPLLPNALGALAAWGFEYKASRVWIKNRAPGIGWFVQTRHELLLIGVKGQGHPSEKLDSVIEGPVTQHSRKPESVYADIEQCYGGPYIELFARRTRDGWNSWGNEI
jgi:N6-adenosine-specific RNA methylase IME4